MYYTLLSAFGEGEAGYNNAKVILSILVGIVTILAICYVTKRLHVLDDLFHPDWTADDFERSHNVDTGLSGYIKESLIREEEQDKKAYKKAILSTDDAFSVSRRKKLLKSRNRK